MAVQRPQTTLAAVVVSFARRGIVTQWSHGRVHRGGQATSVLFPALPEVLSDVDTTNNIFQAHALVRVQPRTGRVRPYAEGLLGFSYAYTSTGVDLGDDADTSTTHLGDYAPSVGGGGGVTILLLSRREARLSLNLGLRYLTGGDADYLTKGAIRRDETGATFEPSRSPLSMVSTQIGMAFEF